MSYAKTSLRAEQRALREKMRELGMSHQQITVEFARRYRVRPRAAWRNAHGWSLTEAAERISNYAASVGLSGGAARGIDLSTITVTERKATLLIDTARAYLQWGRHEKAYIALRAAEDIAHEEVADRPSVHRLVRQLVASAPPAVGRDAAWFAAGIGVSL